jgi:glycosyltransferase involved in cell wall biosynthesis
MEVLKQMLTILTATYNRACTLDRLYDSLLKQSDGDFEWIIIDDGSDDGTRELTANYKKKGDIDIQYISQPNSGKHVALNTGCNVAQGEFVLIVDSDDALVPEAVAVVKRSVSIKPGYVGYCFRKKTFDGKLLGSVTGKEPLIMKPNEAASYFHADLAYVFTKESMQKNCFPVIEGEKFVPELFIWNKIADNGEIVFFPDEWIYLCEYLPDGYSRNFKQNLHKNPRGFALFYRDQIKREKNFFKKAKNIVRSLQCNVWGMLSK